jgi:ATP-dependent DNA helicase RecQ
MGDIGTSRYGERNPRGFDRARAVALLRSGVGHAAAEFRDDQEDAIRHVVSGGGHLLVVQATGWGKSMVYFVATKLLREVGGGPALLVSPLLALMRNQLEAARRMGLRAETVNSDNEDEWDRVQRAVFAGEVDLILVSPERFENERFQQEFLSHLGGSVSMLIVDEAHCISDWGHDFRPHYRLLSRLVQRLPRSVRLIATTATANKRVMKDLEGVLGPGLHVIRGDLARPSLQLQTMQMPGYPSRMAWIAQALHSIRGSGIVYALTVRDAEFLAEWLRYCSLKVEAYYGALQNREQLEADLMSNRLKALVATTALGMGFDKPDVAFVIHFQAPGSVVHYYQQVGRAGRAIDRAHGVLLSGPEDKRINDYFIRSAFPTKAEAADVLNAIRAAPLGLSVSEILAQVNLRESRVKHVLKLLSLESPAPIVKDRSRWKLAPMSAIPDSFWDRTERITAIRKHEQEEMERYVDLKSGHMEFLMQALDGDPLPEASALGEDISSEVDRTLLESAIAFLRERNLRIKPRREWPDGGVTAIGVRGRIAEQDGMETGVALSAWGDGGWSGLVEQGKRTGHFDDALVAAAATVIRKSDSSPRMQWVTCIPSMDRPTLVPDFARRLAAALGLPFVESLAQTKHRPPQKSMENSVCQARNIAESLGLSNPRLPTGPVLLVDDMVDSRWTFTIATCILRRAGVEAAFPFALADTGADS